VLVQHIASHSCVLVRHTVPSISQVDKTKCWHLIYSSFS